MQVFPRNLNALLGARTSSRVRVVAIAVLALVISLLVASWAGGTAWAAENTGNQPVAAPAAPAPAPAAPAPAPAAPAPASASATPPPLTEEQREQQEEAAQEAAERAEEERERREEEECEEEEDREERAKAEQRDGPGTLLGGKDGKIDFGGYGGLTLLGTEVAGQWGFMSGGEAGLLLDHRFAMGGAGFWLTSKVRGPRFPDDTSSVLGFGYGGLSLRYQIVGDGPIYVSLGSLIGGGAIALFEYSDEDGLEFNDDERSANGFFVVEPSVQVHANLTRWMRLGLNGSYRFVHGVNSYGFEEKDLRGWSFGGHLQFGWF